MDLQNINKVTTLEDYAKLTSILLADEFSKRFQLNLVTIRTLKNLRSFELQYFNKVHSVGAASLILDRILQSSWPASMLEDGACANELVLLIRYWLECIRKHLTIEKSHWWKFLNILLDFIQKLPSHTTILTALVRHLGASVLELATRDEVPVETRHRLLICFKCISAAPREVRTEYKDKFDRYFQELARYLCTCGDVCVQFVVVEALLRWVLPREQRAVRRDAAERWLPRALYSRDAVQDFVNRDWKGFIRDTRDFLNIHNKSSNNVISILCYRLRLESVIIKSSTRQRWLDINIGTKRLSVMLDRPMYQMLEISEEEESYLAALYITEGNTEMVKMANSQTKGTRTIEIKVIDPLQMFPAKFLEGKHLVTLFFTAEFDVNKVDNALRAIFDTKYTFVEETGSLTVSRQDSSRISEIITDVETRFSYPPELLGRKPLGPKPPHASTASFSSVFDNAYEPRLRAESQLNTTSNVAESEEHHSCSSLSQIVAQPLLDPSSCTSPNSKSTDRRKGKNFMDERNLIPELRVSVEKDTGIDLLAKEVFDQFHKRLVSTNPENTPREKDKSLSKERKNLNRDRKIPIDKDIIIEQLSQEAFDECPRNIRTTNPENTHREKDKSLAKERENLNRDRKIPTDKDIIIEQLSQEAFDECPRNIRTTNPENTHREKDKSLAKERENLNRDRKIPTDKDIIIEQLSQEAFDECPRNIRTTNPENTHREKDKSLAKERENLNRDRKIPIDKDIIIEQLSQEAFEYFSKNDNMSFQRNNVFHLINAETNNDTIRQKQENGQHNRPLRRVIDDSNTSFIENTNPTTNLKSKIEKEKIISKASKDGNFRQPIFDDKTIETYFSQPLYGQNDTFLALSPTLVKKINDSGASRNSVPVENENQIEVDNSQNADNICVNEKQRNELNTHRAGLQKESLEEITNTHCENKAPPSKKTKGLKLIFNKYDKMPKLSKTGLLPKKRRKSAKPVINENEKTSKVSTDELIETPLIKRRRKLYSERDNDLSKVGIRISETEEETRDSVFIVPKNVQANPKTAATPYAELERIRKNKPLRTFFKRKSSPRKEEVFDQLKATVENTNIVLVDLKSVSKTDVFNFTSSSEANEDFKDKKTVRRTVKKTQRARSKVSKRTRSKSKMQSEMVDERMCKADPCNLNTSIVQELSAEEKMVTEVEPLHNKPRVDMLPECLDSDKETAPPKKSRKRNKKRANETNTKQDSSSGSSLPALEIETAFTKPAHSIINIDTPNKNSYDNLHESNAQCVLKESEPVNDSIKVNTATNRSRSTSSDVISHKKLTVVLNKFDIHNELSISTTGKIPIKAHGVHYESPPKIDDINKTISPRGLEAEGLSDKARMYYNQFLKDTDSTSETHRCSESRAKPKKDKILCLSIPRLPLSELRRYYRGPHEVKSADISASQHAIHQVTLTELPEAETKDRTPSETSPCISRKTIKQPISLETSAKPQVKEKANLKIKNADSLASKSLERVKENHPSTSKPRQDASAELKSVASSFDDWFQRNESAKPKTADIINDVIDTALHKIETWREIDHNANVRLISLFVNVVSEQEKLNSELRQLKRETVQAAQLLNDKIAELDVLVQRKEAFISEFINRSRDFFRRKNRDSAESFRQLVEDIQAFRPPPHDADNEGI